MQIPTKTNSDRTRPRLWPRAPAVLVGVVVALSCALFTGCASALLAGSYSSAPSGKANERTARADAKQLLSRLVLPAHAVRRSREPTGDGGVLSRPASLVGVPALIDLHGWWRVPAKAPSVMAFIGAHPPRGSGRSGSGNGLLKGRYVRYVQFSWPALPGVLGARLLVVNVVALRGGATGVRADAEVQWIVPRPASERIPAGVREIDVTRGRSGRSPTLSRTVTDPGKIRKIVAMVDRLPTVQFVPACPAEPVNPPVVTLRFLSAPAGTVLAEASEVAYARESSGPCEPMTLSIRGHAETPLEEGGMVLRKLGSLLGVKLWTAL